MIKKELVGILAPYPDNAIICMEADHGQVPERAGYVAVTKDEELPGTDFDGEVAWRDIDDVKKNDQVTGIKIG